MNNNKSILLSLLFVCISDFAYGRDVLDLKNYLDNNGTNLNTGYYTNNKIINNFDRIDLKDKNTIAIENSGLITGTFYIENGSELTQVIKNTNDITKLNVNNDGMFTAIISGTGLSLSEIAKNINGVSEIQIDSGTYMFIDNGFDPDLLKNVNMVFNGDTWITIANDYNATAEALLFNVDGENFIHFDTNTGDPFNFINITMCGGNSICLSQNRTINYGEALNNPDGNFLNYLRISGKDDHLISKLDEANNIKEFNDIMNRSVRLHPVLLMRSVHEINISHITDIIRHKPGISLEIEPEYLFSNNTTSVGGNISVDFEVLNNLFIKLSGYGYGMKYEDDINNYKNALYGGNVRIDYFGNYLFVRSVLGANIASFDVGPVLNDKDVVDNPHGFSIYGYADVGKNFSINNELSLSPFVGFGGDSLSVLSEYDNNGFVRAGLDSGYKFDLDNLHQEYTLRMAINTDGYFDASFNFDVWSNIDSAGAELSVGLMQTEIGTSGKVSGKFKFTF